ncbi:nephrocystin-4 isoform X1 [Lates japonicus]|uniref:Nephrocystin-4 isoform X1 n=1 Tax=Lates japonicus TaxID=270547 RepID=A0AAD3NL64_LATJO|nr:nephrocystin-4 isoform X1 [Lates japonicus]
MHVQQINSSRCLSWQLLHATPTISHSSSALLWQQSFPSLLHPSPLASAHQLSHVACSAVSNIAHLEMDLQREGGVSPSGQNEGDQLQELPFTPVHAPVITLGMNLASWDHGLQRAGVEVLDPEPVPLTPQREKDPLQGNLLVFSFWGSPARQALDDMKL